MKKLLPCAMLLVLAACPSDGTGPGDGTAMLRFSHTAAGTLLPAGTYEAEGEVRMSGQGQIQPGEWVYALIGVPPSLLRVNASQRSAIVDGRYDLVMMELPVGLQAGGGVPIHAPCTGLPDCAQVQVRLGVRAQADQTPEMTCTLDGATVTVTARSATRVQGTFSGPGTCYVSEGSAPFQVTGGHVRRPHPGLRLTRAGRGACRPSRSRCNPGAGARIQAERGPVPRGLLTPDGGGGWS